MLLLRSALGGGWETVGNAATMMCGGGGGSEQPDGNGRCGGGTVGLAAELLGLQALDNSVGQSGSGRIEKVGAHETNRFGTFVERP